MDKKILLTEEQIKDVLDKLGSGEFVYSEEPFYSEKTSWICVEEFDGPVKACYYYKQDGIKTSAPSVNICFRIEVAGLKFACSSDYNKIGGWNIESEKFALPEDTDLRKSLTDELSRHLPKFEYDVLDYARVKYWDYCVMFEEEWTKDEIIDEIAGELTYSQYVKIGDEIYPVYDTLEEALKEHGINVDSESYTIITPREVAEALAENIDLGPNSF